MKIKATVKEDAPSDTKTGHYNNVLTTDVQEPKPPTVDASGSNVALGTPACSGALDSMTSGPEQITSNSTMSPPNRTEAAECPAGTKFNPETGKCEPMMSDEEALGRSSSIDATAQAKNDPPSTKTRAPVPPQHTTTFSGTPYNTTGDTSMHATEPNQVKFNTADKIATGFTWSAEALQEKVARFKAEDRARGLDEQLTMWQKRFSDVSEELVALNGRYNEQKLQVQQANDRMENAVRDMHNAQVERERYERLRNDAAGEKDEAKLAYEKLVTAHKVMEDKYNKALTTNLELSQKLTAANEDYLEMARKLEAANDALGRSRVEAKKILKIRV